MARASDPIQARRIAVGIVRTLRAAGHTAYFAGGCVRDELLGLHPTDFDVATDATPPVVRSLFPRTAEVGAAFGVVLVHDAGVTVEVATFRSDGPYTDARRPDAVRFSDPLSDAQRRDFTINALFLDPLAPDSAPERIVDFVNGRADLQAKLLRAVGDPDKRLAEDHLRALRAVRFTARLGFRLDPATADAICRHAAELRGVSRERIGDELRRMFAHPARAAAVELLHTLALDEPVLNEPSVSLGIAQAAVVRSLAAPPPFEPSFALILAAWAIDRALARMAAGSAPASHDSATPIPPSEIPGVIRRWRAALCLSNDEASELSETLTNLSTLLERWPSLRIAHRKRAAAAAWFSNTLRLSRALHPAIAGQIGTEVARLAADGIGIAPPAFIDGDELVRMGYPPGPAFRRVLDETYDAQLEGRVTSQDQARELVRRLYV